MVDTATRTPVFHDQAGVRVGPGGSTVLVTRCDRTVARFDAVLRREHAELFCRPCKRCYAFG